MLDNKANRLKIEKFNNIYMESIDYHELSTEILKKTQDKVAKIDDKE